MRWDVVYHALGLVMPSYFSNLFPPLSRGKIPVDLGKSIRGKRVFGDGKTVEGLLFGIMGALLGGVASNYMGIEMGIVPSIVMGVASLIGDLAGSFIKRRLGMMRGQSFPVLDQLGFVVFGMIGASPFLNFTFVDVIIILTVTPVLHLLANWAGYVAGVKREPW